MITVALAFVTFGVFTILVVTLVVEVHSWLGTPWDECVTKSLTKALYSLHFIVSPVSSSLDVR